VHEVQQNRCRLLGTAERHPVADLCQTPKPARFSVRHTSSLLCNNLYYVIHPYVTLSTT
jgi:hypothetical protein